MWFSLLLQGESVTTIEMSTLHTILGGLGGADGPVVQLYFRVPRIRSSFALTSWSEEILP